MDSRERLFYRGGNLGRSQFTAHLPRVEVDCFEDWLKDPANAVKKQHMVVMLASVGGFKSLSLTWNILAHIFSDGVAKAISWKGVNNERKFSVMAAKALLAWAVQKSPLSEKAIDTEINGHAIMWVNLASDRGGGCSARSHVVPATIKK